MSKKCYTCMRGNLMTAEYSAEAADDMKRVLEVLAETAVIDLSFKRDMDEVEIQ